MASTPTSRSETIARKAARVVESWPSLPFWLRRRLDLQAHLALPGAAVSAAAMIAALLFEPAFHFSSYRSIPFDFLGEPRVFLLLSLLAPLATFAVLDPGTRRHFLTRASSWLGLLPVVGLFAVAVAQANLDEARRDRPRVPRFPKVRLASRPQPRSPWSRIASAGFDHFRGGLFWQGVLFASHLGWLFGALAFLVAREGPRAALLAAFACLHLLAMASACLMMIDQRRRTLRPAGWAGRWLPFLLLLPVPLNMLSGFLFFLTQSKEKRNSLAAVAFGVKGPMHRLAAFRVFLPARRRILAAVQDGGGDPFRMLAEVRQARERPWLELHRVALFFQTSAAVGILASSRPGLAAPGALLWWTCLAAAFLSVLIHSALLIWGSGKNISRFTTALEHLSGVFFVLVLALPAGAALSLPAPAALGVLPKVLTAGAILILGVLPFEVLIAPARLRRLPPSIVRGVGLALSGLALSVLRLAVPDESLVAGLKAVAAASFLASPLLLTLAKRLEAPAIARSRWLAIPFSALLLPVLRGPAGSSARRSEGRLWQHATLGASSSLPVISTSACSPPSAQFRDEPTED